MLKPRQPVVKVVVDIENIISPVEDDDDGFGDYDDDEDEDFEDEEDDFGDEESDEDDDDESDEEEEYEDDECRLLRLGLLLLPLRLLFLLLAGVGALLIHELARRFAVPPGPAAS